MYLTNYCYGKPTNLGEILLILYMLNQYNYYYYNLNVSMEDILRHNTHCMHNNLYCIRKRSHTIHSMQYLGRYMIDKHIYFQIHMNQFPKFIKKNQFKQNYYKISLKMLSKFFLLYYSLLLSM